MQVSEQHHSLHIASQIAAQIAQELAVKPEQIIAAVSLLDAGDTVPFISRYRKEVTGSLDDTQLRQVEERLKYLRELEQRRDSILKSIDEQGKLTATTKTNLEDLYLPYKKKRRTKGQIAIEAGLEPLANALLEDPTLHPEQQAESYLLEAKEGEESAVPDVKAALDGAKFILMERFSEEAQLLNDLRSYLEDKAVMSVTVAKGKEQEGAKFRDYFEYQEAYQKIPSHRARSWASPPM